MTTNAFRWGMWLVLLAGLAVVGAVITSFSPYQNQGSLERNFKNIALFYFSLSVFLTGFFSLFLFWIKKGSTSDELMNVHMGVSFRQGLFLSIIVIVILILQSFRVLTWWDGLLAVGAVLMIELYFLAR
ncbi:MAG: hypothetical protein U9O20_03755 [Patescibacteria group bacterium]|nr:hypothetical protein [Patescibacteria group bacterium]